MIYLPVPKYVRVLPSSLGTVVLTGWVACDRHRWRRSLRPGRVFGVPAINVQGYLLHLDKAWTVDPSGPIPPRAPGPSCPAPVCSGGIA